MPAYKDAQKGTWYAAFYYQDWKGVKKKKLKRGFPTKKEALAWERTFLLQQAADLTMTFEAFVEIYEKCLAGGDIVVLKHNQEPKYLSYVLATTDAILRAKGFTTYVSPAGPDKGVDILASAGTLGFGSPKICVQVKSTDAPVDRIVLDQLGGVMKNFGAEYGLLVSWSGFKSSVINETAKQFFEIRLWTHKEIIEEFLRYYDQTDDEIKELIPLKKIWVVNNSEE